MLRVWVLLSTRMRDVNSLDFADAWPGSWTAGVTYNDLTILNTLLESNIIQVCVGVWVGGGVEGGHAPCVRN